ncbi:hypothetical protein HKX69_05825 [Streptomyces argyrophyllae]|uniref:Head-tail adaptor protein n=1 Tax=Streptomyces argyrophylli TaxID=2726118 RepID=A0A6M4PHF9_9ACTN|nr:hypothetical protein [Streptomyces argyrophyllae]QJS09096.1 hypothetical protein HKX69_05825 [Streptomyces argyrophyllae]
MALFNDQIEIHRAPLVTDDYGKHRDWDNATVVWSGRGAGVPYRRTEKPDEATRETSVRRATCYLPGDVAVDSADRILFQGRAWSPEGDAWKWKLGSRQYTMLNVRTVTK